MIEIKFKDFNEFAKRLGEFPRIIKNEIYDAIRNSALLTAKEIYHEAPVKTGQLRNSIFVEFPRMNEARVFIGPPRDKVAYYIEHGTRPHLIEPVRAKALKFKWGHKEIFAKRVSHPGIKPNPFMKRSFEAVEPRVNRIFEEAIEKVLKHLEL